MHSIIDYTVSKVFLLKRGLKTKLCLKQFFSSFHNYFKFTKLPPAQVNNY